MATQKHKPEIAITMLTVADLHQSRELYRQLSLAVAKHRPDMVAIVGDCLHAGDDMEGRLTTAECATAIAALACKGIVFVRGNHEDENWDVFKRHWPQAKKLLLTLHGEAFRHGPLTVVGWPCLLGSEDSFIAPRASLCFEPDDWLKPLMRLHGASFRTLWLMHEPPQGTPLSAANSVVAGNQEWTAAIRDFQPRLVICGHDHVTPIRTKRWHCRIGATTCINVGQTDHGPLRHCVIKFRFNNDSPSLPAAIQATAFPMNETILI